MAEQWVSMKEASDILGVSQSRISRLASIGAIQTKTNRLNRRVRLVNVEEIRKLLESGQIIEEDRE